MPPDAPRKVRIPRWVQLVGLPLILVGAWQFMSAVSHAMFIFVVAALIAILLNPIVRAFCALRIPRALAVFLVYLTFAVTFVALGVLAGTVIATQVQSASTVVENEFSTAPGQTQTPAEMKLDDLQHWLDDHGLSQVNVRQLGDKVQQKVNSLDIESVSGQAVGVAQGVLLGVAESLFNVVLVIVVSVYMLLDAPRLSRFLRRLFPPAEGEDDLVVRLERALLVLRPRPDAGVAGDRCDRRRADVDPGRARDLPGRQRLRDRLRRVRRADRGDPLRGAVDRGDPADGGGAGGVARRRRSPSRWRSCSSTRSRATS